MTKRRTHIDVIDKGVVNKRADEVATEEPLEIRLKLGGETRTVAVTMRTPGSDFELAAGFLYSEGVVNERTAISGISYCHDREVIPEERFNIVTVDLAGQTMPDLRNLERHFFMSSSCGVCGKASLDALSLKGHLPIEDDVEVRSDVLYSLPERLQAEQNLFGTTGGLHAAGLFSPTGEAFAIREDVGRHNALDKLIGWALLHDKLPFSGGIVMVSGRSSFEIMQKSLVARAPIVCAVSAPSSLAVDVASRFGITLVGFLRGERFNIYAQPQRVRTLTA